MTIDTLIAETFAEYYPQGSIEETNSIPEGLMSVLRSEYDSGPFENFYLIDHDNGEKTYVAKKVKIYHLTRGSLKLMGLIDVNEDNIHIGHGEIMVDNSEKEIYKDQPFVAYTDTVKKYRRQGLGMRRLYVMNALSQAFYQLPLYSGFAIKPSAEGVWQRLVEQGVAKIYEDERFVFLEK